MNRRTLVGLAASTITLGVTTNAFAKQKQHLNGQALLGSKIKQNGKHKIHKAGKADVFATVNNGKVVDMSASGMQVKKVKSRQKFAESDAGLIRTGFELAQTEVYYYGYWVYDDYGDYYYWYTTDVVIVDSSWVLI